MDRHVVHFHVHVIRAEILLCPFNTTLVYTKGAHKTIFRLIYKSPVTTFKGFAITQNDFNH